jgi:hypothetical protein
MQVAVGVEPPVAVSQTAALPANVQPPATPAGEAPASVTTTTITPPAATPPTVTATEPASTTTPVAPGAEQGTPVAGMEPGAAKSIETMPVVPTGTAKAETTPGADSARVATLPSGLNPPGGDVAMPPVQPSTNPTEVPGASKEIASKEGAATPVGQPPVGQPPVASLGTFLGGKTVLLRYNEKQQAWFRVEPQAAVVVGDRLLALPEFRPRITFASGVGMDVSGGTLVTMRTADAVTADGLPAGDARGLAIEIGYGRIVLTNSAAEEQRLRLTFGPSTADVRLAGGAKLGVQVEREYVPGIDPRKIPSPVLTQVVAPAGGVVWQDRSGERPAMGAVQWTVKDGVASVPAPLAQPVEWIDREPAGRGSEQLAAPVIQTALVIDRPADDQLLEIYLEGQRREVKWLAARCSIHVGMFVPSISALRDSDQRPNWRRHIDTLRAAMALNRESAEHVWRTLEEQRGARAAVDLYELLCGYSLEQVGRTPEQRRSGALAVLINWLNSDNLDYRVLAVENLSDITGKRLMPNPAGSATERAAGIRDWTRRLAADELMPPPVGQ